jgi:hypothetical protein
MTPNRFHPLTLAVGLALAWPVHAGSPINGNHAAAPDARVEISNVRGRISVTGWDQASVSVTGTLGEGSKFEIGGSEQHVIIKVDNPDDDSWSWWGNRGPREDSILEVNVPRAAALDADGVSADILVEGLKGGRDIELESVSGDLRLRGDAERVELSTVSGDADLEGTSRSVNLESVSGDITARGIGGRISAESVSGRIELTATDTDEVTSGTVSGDVNVEVGKLGGGRVKIESMSGDVTLDLPTDSSARIDVETFSGSIRSDFGTVDKEEHGPGSSLKTMIGKGDAQITLESFSGDVDINGR